MPPLITTNAQLKQYNSAIQKDADFGSFVSFQIDASLNYLVPAIGQATYDALAATSGLTDKQIFAQNLFRKAEVNFMVSAWVNFGSVQLSESGAHVIQDATRKIASDKKIAALRKQSFIDACTALENGVNYLEANLADFTVYAATPQHALNRGNFINTTVDFNSYSYINSNAQLLRAMRAILTNAEEEYIEPALGQVLTTTLRTAILAGTTSSDQNKLLTRIGKALAPLTIAQAIPYQMLEIDANGVVTNSIGNGGMSSGNTELQEPADTSKLQILMNAAQMRGQDNLARLRQYLNDNTDKFTDYEVVDLTTSETLNTTERGNYFV